MDIRADIYGLGGTLYYLLTGQAPFPEGTPTEKILKHARTPAPVVELLRPDVPAEVGALVRKLLAKAPAERFQTPAELAAALEPFGLETASATPRSSVKRVIPAAGTPRPVKTASRFRMPRIFRRWWDEIRKK